MQKWLRRRSRALALAVEPLPESLNLDENMTQHLAIGRVMVKVLGRCTQLKGPEGEGKQGNGATNDEESCEVR